MAKKTTTAARLEWVLHFARLDLEHLRPGDRMNLVDELAEFLGRVPGGYEPARDIAGITISAIGDLENPSDAELLELQRQTSELVEQIAGFHRSELRSLEKVRWHIWPDENEGYFIHLLGAYQDLFLFLVAKLITERSAGDFRRCTECDSFFLRTDPRQIYCSLRCRNRVSQRLDRARKTATKARARKKKKGVRRAKKR